MKRLYFLFLILLLSPVIHGQSSQKTTEDLFKEYLISEDDSLAKIIVGSGDNLYSVYCQATLIENSNEKIKLYSRFIQMNPKCGISNAYMNRGIEYSSGDKYDSALIDFNKSISLTPDEPYAYFFRGQAYAGLEKDGKALDDYFKAIELQPDFMLAFYMRSLTYLNLKSYKEALDDLNKVIQMDKNYDKAFLIRGIVYDNTGEHKKAIADWKLAKKMNAENTADSDALIEKANQEMKEEKEKK